MTEQKKVPYTMEIKKTAVLVVDMQNDFVRVGGSMSLQSCRDAIPYATKILDACRQVKIPVIYLKFITGLDVVAPRVSAGEMLLETSQALLRGYRQGGRGKRYH